MGNEGFLELELIDVRGQPVKDPRVTVIVSHGNGGQIGRITRAFPDPGFPRIKVPAFPQASMLKAEVVPSRYRRRPMGFFVVTHDEVILRKLTVLRKPKKWRPEFVEWDDLTATFDPLKQVLGDSRGIQVRGLFGESIEDFTGAPYDGPHETVVANAKAGLLNLFAKLSEEKDPTTPGSDWFSYVQEIEVIGKSRFIARVLPEMGESVQSIRQDFPAFPRYESTPVGDHAGNFPHELRIREGEMYSVKTDDEKGNLQLTFAPGRDADGQDALYLDTDIDENGELFQHMIDVLFLHPFNGGTRPLDIHEYLALDYPERPLGYAPVLA